MTCKRVLMALALTCLVTGFAGQAVGARSKQTVRKKEPGRWSIGIYTGDSPWTLAPAAGVRMPVLRAADVTDRPASFVADPFMIEEGTAWYMFFEAAGRGGKGAIGLAESEDGVHWSYRQTVLEEPFHLSYPYVFKWNGDYYMIPESVHAHAIRLYKAVGFPVEWQYVGRLLHGDYVDSSIFRYDEKWWLFTTDAQTHNADLRLFYADDLKGPWTEHPASPVVSHDPRMARSGGRIISYDGRVIRYAQDDVPRYGSRVRAFEVTTLTTTTYEEIELTKRAVLKGSGAGWNALGMHNIDPHCVGQRHWIACVDGLGHS